MVAFGAMPPKGREWEVGKTAASIQYVRASERLLEVETSPRVAAHLRSNMDYVKEGKTVIDRFMTDDEVLLLAQVDSDTTF